jgi:arylsulfatase A-like enzyme
MMTGRHQVRFGIEGNPPIKERNYGVPTSEPMLAERLKKLGYTTGPYRQVASRQHHGTYAATSRIR